MQLFRNSIQLLRIFIIFFFSLQNILKGETRAAYEGKQQTLNVNLNGRSTKGLVMISLLVPLTVAGLSYYMLYATVYVIPSHFYKGS